MFKKKQCNNITVTNDDASCSWQFNEDNNCNITCDTDCYNQPINKDGESLNLVDPFNNYVKKLKALFGADNDVTVLSDEEAKVINICVSGCEKPDAYRTFFPGQVKLNDNLTVKILINGHWKSYVSKISIEVLKAMFHHHPLVADIKITHLVGSGTSRLFVLFKNKTIQYVNDNFGSLYNATTTVPQNLIREICLRFGYSIWWSTESDFDVSQMVID